MKKLMPMAGLETIRKYSGCPPPALCDRLPAWRLLVIGMAMFAAGGASAKAAVFEVGPANYRAVLATLGPGDELRLGPGVYDDGLPIHGLNGTGAEPIIISGAAGSRPSVLLGRPGSNTVSIRNAAHIIVRDLELDGRGAFVDAVKAEGSAAYAHHIRLERLAIHGYSRHQQAVGISTKCPAWNWSIVDNRIVGAGTGIYLGDSDGSAPFVDGLIEGNVVRDTTGYSLQIKHQLARPALAEFPRDRRRTIIRYNRFGKARGASAGADARPNVLLGHFPLDGPGHDDEYLVYGNYFLQNPHEALFQGEGNLALYANVFVNTYDNGFPAVAIQPHKDVPRRVRIVLNSVLHPGVGIRIDAGEARTGGEFEQIAAGNLIFADSGVEGGMQYQNLTQPIQAFGGRPASLGADPCVTGLQAGALQDMPLELARFGELPALREDFHGRRRDMRERGACMAVGAPLDQAKGERYSR
ncbi:MAG: hypothetical protein RLW62_24410, partial [Gammaproteobacteria bacterium]